MTWGKLQVLVEALLGADNVFKKDKEYRLALLEYALYDIANKATTLRLLTSNINQHIIRDARDGKYIREASLPDDDNEEVDIDRGLVYAVARTICSYLVTDINRRQIHLIEAKTLIDLYNQKVTAYLERLAQDDSNTPYSPSVDY